MATTKTYKVAGTSTQNGVTKVRFAQDYVSRFKILNKNGHTNIELLEIGESMSKADICKMLMSHPKFQAEDQQSAISTFVVKNIKPQAEADVAPQADSQAQSDLVEVELETSNS
jgi:hypothetical protein